MCIPVVYTDNPFQLAVLKRHGRFYIHKMYKINYSQTKHYSNEGYNKFVKQSLERLTAHFGNYSGGYQPQQSKRNTDYDIFK